MPAAPRYHRLASKLGGRAGVVGHVVMHDQFARNDLGGGGINGGIAVGETNEDGTRVETEPYSAEDLMATVCRAMGISLETTFTSKNGRPMKIANGGKVIKELIA